MTSPIIVLLKFRHTIKTQAKMFFAVTILSIVGVGLELGQAAQDIHPSTKPPPTHNTQHIPNAHWWAVE